MIDIAKLTDGELLELLELSRARASMAGAGELRKVVDTIAAMGLEAAGRLCAAPRPPALEGVARRVVVHADGRLTCDLEISNGAAGARFLEQIRVARS